MKTIDDLALVVLRVATEANEGRANPVQAELLCKSADVMVKLARLHLDVAAAHDGGLVVAQWLGAPQKALGLPAVKKPGTA